MTHTHLKRIRQKWVEKGFQRYLKNTGWMFTSRILSLAISFGATLYIARNLGPTNFGQLSYAVSFVGLFSFISSLGIGALLYRDLLKWPEKHNEIFGTSFVINFVAGAVTTLVCFFMSQYYSPDDVSKLLIYILSGTFIANAFQLPLFDFQAKTQSKYPAIISILAACILNGLKILVIMSGKGVIYLALVLLFESILYALSYTMAYELFTEGTMRKWVFSWNYAKELLRDCLPLIVLSAFSVIYARVDQVLIKHMLDARSVGLYDAAVRLSEVWGFIPVLLTTSLYPAIINSKKVSEDLYTARLAKLAGILIFSSILIALPVTFLASFIIDIVYGATFNESATVLKIYIWSNIGLFLGTLINQYLITENHRKVLTGIAFIPMITNVVLNIIWIPVYGISGAAYATLISYSLTPFCLLLFPTTRKKVTRMLR